MATDSSEITYEDFFLQWKDPAEDTIEAHTSGSTGIPKHILLPKSLMRLSAARTIRYFGIDADWLLGSCISPRYIGGKMMAVRASESGAEFFYLPPSNQPDLTPALTTDKKSLISVVPSQLWHILSLNLTDEQKNRLHFLVGGSAIPDDLRKAVAEKGLKAWESYGMTETASHIALRPISEKCCPFIPLPGIELSVSDKGTLVITNWGSEDPLITNDLVEFTSIQGIPTAKGLSSPEGFPSSEGIPTLLGFRITGRADNVIVTGGLKVSPEQLESKIRRILREQDPQFAFSELMITSRPDPKWSRAIVMLIETEDSLQRSEKQSVEIHSLLKASPDILPHEVPKEIHFVDSLPRTPNGKLQRTPLS